MRSQMFFLEHAGSTHLGTLGAVTPKLTIGIIQRYKEGTASCCLHLSHPIPVLGISKVASGTATSTTCLLILPVQHVYV